MSFANAPPQQPVAASASIQHICSPSRTRAGRSRRSPGVAILFHDAQVGCHAVLSRYVQRACESPAMARHRRPHFQVKLQPPFSLKIAGNAANRPAVSAIDARLR